MRGISVRLVFLVILLVLVVVSSLVVVVASGPPSSSRSSDLDDDSDIPASHLPLPLTSKHDTAVVAAPDGTIYLVEINSGKVLWSFASGSPIYSSYQAVHHNEGQRNNATTWADDFFIDIGEDWQLYVNGNGLKNVKLPVSVEEFLKSTPFISASGGIMLGSKKSTIFIVDAKTGKVIHTLCSDTVRAVEHEHNDESTLVARTDFGGWVPHSATNLDGIEEPLYVTRKDYVLKFTNMKTGKILWYLMFADIEASYQCNAIESFLGSVFYTEDEVSLRKNLDAKLQLHCPPKPVVYRIRDRSSFKSLFKTNSLPDAFAGDKVLLLAAPDLDPMLQLVEKILGLHQSNGGDIGLALPTPESEDFGVVALPEGDIDQIHEIGGFANLIGSHFWFVALFGGLMLLIVTFFVSHWVVKEQGKLNKGVEMPNIQALTTRKKKPRKPRTNSKTAERKKKNVSHDQMAKDINVLPDYERAKKFLQLGLPNNSDGFMDGRNIGRLFVSTTGIAMGSNGTVVLEGIYDGRPVAVKRLVQTHHNVAFKEIQNLIASDHHPNIVRWFGVEYDQDFVYLALERCACSLYDLILSCSSSQNQETYQDGDCNCAGNEFVRLGLLGDNHALQLSKSNGYPSHHLLKLMRDVVRGLAHLHELGIIHRDLKPQNVLVTKERVLCAKLSDMGINKRLSGDTSSLTKHATGYGSSGWQAPEQLLHERQTRAVDLFSLGCLLFFCITGGKHPFGEILERDVNIVNNQKDLFLIENLPEATDLIASLLHCNPELRPKATQVACHPLFWDSEMRLSFLRDASDRVELEDREKESELLKALESIGNVALGGKWDEKMDTAFINDIGRYRRYKFDSVRDLLRVIRNKLNHYRELPKDIQGILGQVPEGFDNYFSTRFPKLVIEVFKVFHLYCAEEEEAFIKYFKCDYM
ncbi:serine/threonine-protein kinase/endoribonuclease IRE1b-like isoform X1 [Coffea arabica]|uniref:non-specific serine/threonine protein kinase n=2 Tax=Coffea arabica TaxID=13443 RepID=A0ABM4VTS7_COFAR